MRRTEGFSGAAAQPPTSKKHIFSRSKAKFGAYKTLDLPSRSLEKTKRPGQKQKNHQKCALHQDTTEANHNALKRLRAPDQDMAGRKRCACDVLLSAFLMSKINSQASKTFQDYQSFQEQIMLEVFNRVNVLFSERCEHLKSKKCLADLLNPSKTYLHSLQLQPEVWHRKVKLPG